MFDVLVCGAGPAGAVAATVLARAGARVLVLDRAQFPRGKLCGDTLNPGTLAVLRRLQMTTRFERHALPLDGMTVSGERGAQVRGAYGPGVQALALVRRDLDLALLQEAEAAGARIEQGVLVKEPLMSSEQAGARVSGVVIAGRDGGDLRIPAPFVIAADGRRSRLGFALGLLRHSPRPRRWAVGAYFENVAGLTSFGEMHVRNDAYLGIAPIPGGLANVCLVTARRSGLDDPESLLRHATRTDRLLSDRFASARMVDRPVVLGPLAVNASAAGVSGLLLAGDAAGFIDPITGDGLRFATRGAELAAEAVLAALNGRIRAPHEALARLRHREFVGKWRFNRAVRSIVAAPRAISAASTAASIVPWIIRRAIVFAGDATRA